jgi:vacuolar-type H+-ATPase subunit I/STV1
MNIEKVPIEIVGLKTDLDPILHALRNLGWVQIDDLSDLPEVDAIIQLAETQLRLTRLAAEIQCTSRRLNALENLLIPRLEAERDFIQMALDERERSDHFRLKLVKRTLERKRELNTSPTIIESSARTSIPISSKE